MNTKIATPLQTINAEILDELKGIITEGIFHYRWTLIETNHEVGKLLVENEDKLPKNYVKLVAKELKQKERHIYSCCQFYRKYPDLSKLPDGKIISWHKIYNNLLTDNRKDKPTPEEKLLEMIDDFCKDKSVPSARRQLVKQLIQEWEAYKKERKNG